jgi:hypothetical protein
VSRTAAVVAAALVATAASARAQAYEPTMELPPSATAPLAQPSQPPADDLVTSYRPWTMAVDVVSLGTIVGGFAMPGNHFHDTSDAIISAGILGGFLATPIIHAARGHGMRAVGSFVLRGLVAGTGAMIGVATAECRPEEWFCGLDRMGPGMTAGLAVAMVIDNIWLTDEHTPRPRAGQPVWSPIVAPRPGGGTLGLAASW